MNGRLSVAISSRCVAGGRRAPPHEQEAENAAGCPKLCSEYVANYRLDCGSGRAGKWDYCGDDPSLRARKVARSRCLLSTQCGH
jgi:hypothetical protein